MGQDCAEWVMDLSSSVEGHLTPPSLLQGDVMRPHKGSLGDGRSDHRGIDPFCDSRAGYPIATSGSQEGIEKTFSSSGLLQHMVVPP